MPLDEYSTGSWNAGSISMQTVGKKGRCTYHLKRYLNPPWPADGDMRDARILEQAKRCEELFKKRKEMNACLKKADGRSKSIAYAEDIFLSTDKDAPGVIEAVRQVNGVRDQDWVRQDGRRLHGALLSCAEAVRRLHAAGIVHADLKPENILIVTGSNASTRAVLIDFDRSYMVRETPGPEDIGGSTGFMAPEAIAYYNDEDCEEDGSDSKFRSALSEKRDIFSLGVVFYVLLTGEALAWDGSRPVLDKVDEQSGLSADWLKSLLSSMLEMDPDDRPDADAVVSTLSANRLAFEQVNFEALWPEHAKEFSYAADLSRYARICRREADNMRQYMVYYQKGGERLYTIQMLYNVGIVTRDKSQKSMEGSVGCAREKADAEGEGLWPEHAGYEINEDMMRRNGYGKLLRTTRHGEHGYSVAIEGEGNVSKSFAVLLWEGCIQEKPH